MTKQLTDAPERIFTEPQPYDFAGYSPCWVWHSSEGIDDTSGLTEYVRADMFTTLQSEITALRTESERLMDALDPVTHWYQSDEDHQRPWADIVKDIVADLQSDRAENIALRADNASLAASLQREVNARGIPWRDGPPGDDLKDGRQVLCESTGCTEMVLLRWVKDGGHFAWRDWDLDDHLTITRHCPIEPKS